MSEWETSLVRPNLVAKPKISLHYLVGVLEQLCRTETEGVTTLGNKVARMVPSKTDLDNALSFQGVNAGSEGCRFSK